MLKTIKTKPRSHNPPCFISNSLETKQVMRTGFGLSHPPARGMRDVNAMAGVARPDADVSF